MVTQKFTFVYEAFKIPQTVNLSKVLEFPSTIMKHVKKRQLYSSQVACRIIGTKFVYYLTAFGTQ